MNFTTQLIEPEVRELLREGAYSELRAALRGLPPADVADIVSVLDPEDAAVLFRFLPRDDGGEVFSYLDADRQQAVIEQLGAAAVRTIEGMDVDDRARLLDELPSPVAQRLVASLNPEDRRRTQAILGYPPKSVGRLMTPEYVSVRPDWTIAQSMEHIRAHGKDAETINVVYVVDEHGTLIDDIRLRSVLLADPAARVESLMTRSFVSLRADQDQEEAVRLMSRYDRIALPVVDTRGVLLGIVTSDDVADVAEAEATEDIQKIGGMGALESSYMSAPVADMIRKRAPWLCALFCGQLLTIWVIDYFQGELAKAVVLATLIPLILSSGGNTGSQAASLLIRALALNELTVADWWRVARKELAVGAVLGLTLGLLGCARILIWHAAGIHDYGEHFVLVGLSVGLTLLALVAWASLVGSLLPLLLRRLGLDPAASSTPFVATLMDVSGLLIYFSVAVLMLKGSVL